MADFADGKDAGALRTIGEVGDALGIKPHVLRYWEDQFPQLKPLKRAGGRRLYRPEDVALVRQIDRMVNREGYTLRGAKAALGAAEGKAAEGKVDAGKGDAGKVQAPQQPASSDLLPRLKAIRADLAAALAG